jgi:hypothetical protein
MELNPQVVFERLFGSGSTPEQRAQRMRQSRSILDSLVAELASLRRQLGPADVQTVNQYTEEIREMRANWGIFRDRRPDLYWPLMTLDGTTPQAALPVSRAVV